MGLSTAQGALRDVLSDLGWSTVVLANLPPEAEIEAAPLWREILRALEEGGDLNQGAIRTAISDRNANVASSKAAVSVALEDLRLRELVDRARTVGGRLRQSGLADGKSPHVRAHRRRTLPAGRRRTACAPDLGASPEGHRPLRRRQLRVRAPQGAGGGKSADPIARSRHLSISSSSFSPASC